MKYSKYVAPKPQQSITEDTYLRLQQTNTAIVTRKHNGFHIEVSRVDGTLKPASAAGIVDFSEGLPNILPLLRNLINEGDHFVGELVHTSDNTEHLQAALNDKDDTHLSIRFYDIMLQANEPIFNQPYSQRLAQITARLKDQPITLSLVDKVDASLTLQQQLELVTLNNWEGTVIADSTAPAIFKQGTPGRGLTWKNKPRFTEEFIATTAKLSSTGQLLTLKATTIDGKPVGTLGSFHETFSRHPRTNPILVEVAHYGKDERNNLIFPVVLRERTRVMGQLL